MLEMRGVHVSRVPCQALCCPAQLGKRHCEQGNPGTAENDIRQEQVWKLEWWAPSFKIHFERCM